MHVSDSPDLNRYLANRQWCTTEDTNASIWDSSLPGAQDGTVDDGELRTKLGSVVRQHHDRQLPVPQDSACTKLLAQVFHVGNR